MDETPKRIEHKHEVWLLIDSDTSASAIKLLLDEIPEGADAKLDGMLLNSGPFRLRATWFEK